MITNHIIYLIGPPGVGKFTVGSLLARELNCILVDNHYWLNPIFGVIEQDGVTPLPQAVWSLVGKVRAAVFEAIATLSPAHWSFIFTHTATGDPLDDAICSDIMATVKRRGAKLLVAQLSCGPEELARRVVAPERRKRMKDADPVSARMNATLPLYDPGHPNTISIDTSQLTAQGVAQQIISAVQS